MALTGVPDQTFAFLSSIGEHNDREWFQAHRAEHARADLLRHDGLIAWAGLPAANARSPKLPTVVVGHNRKLAPIERWMVDLIAAR